MQSGSWTKYSRGWMLLVLLLVMGGMAGVQSAFAEKSGSDPLPQAEPTPFGSVGSCELLDGSYETCYEPMCSLEWHEPPGETGVWVWRLLFRFRGCNPYDGCVYTTMDTCEDGCDSSDPLNHTCGEDVEDSDDWEDPDDQVYPDPADDPCYGVHCPAAMCDGNTSYFGGAACDPAFGMCSYNSSEYCEYGCDGSTGYCIEGDDQIYSDPDDDPCYGVHCPAAMCEGDTSYYGGAACDPASGGCLYDYSKYCDYGCNPDTGYCIESSELNLCENNPCEPFCQDDVSWYNGECDPEDGGCFFEQETCTQGCDPETGYCISPNTGDLCAGVDCSSFCEGNVSYHTGSCDSSDGACLYHTETCQFGCNADTGLCLAENQSGLCAGVSCPSFCENGVSWTNGQCDPADGLCAYYTTPCEAGCNEVTGACYPVASGTDDLLRLLAVGGGLAVAGGGTAGGGLLLYRFLKGRKPPTPGALKPKAPTPVPSPQADPILESLNTQGDRVDRLLKQLDDIHRGHLRHGMDTQQRLAEIAEHKEDVVNMFDSGVQWAKKIADTGADIVGLTPGVGRTFKYGYKGVTNWVERGLESYLVDGNDALTSVALGYQKANLEVAKAVIGDEIGDFIPVPGVNDLGRINVKYARESVSTIIKRKGLANYGTNIIKDKYVSKAVDQGERLIRVTADKIR